MAGGEGTGVTTGQPNLFKQDLSKLDVSKLTALSKEVISRQATINIGTIGHVAHGKSTVVKAISGVQTVRFKNELERNITIKLDSRQSHVERANGRINYSSVMKPDEVVALLPKSRLMSAKPPAVDTKVTESAFTADLEEQLTNRTATPSAKIRKIVKYNNVIKNTILSDKLIENGVLPVHEKDKLVPDRRNGDSKKSSSFTNEYSKNISRTRSCSVECGVSFDMKMADQAFVDTGYSINSGINENFNAEYAINEDSSDSSLLDIITNVTVNVPRGRSLPNSLELPQSEPNNVIVSQAESLNAESSSISEEPKKAKSKPKAKKRVSLDRVFCQTSPRKFARKSAPPKVKVPKVPKKAPKDVYEVEKIVDHLEFPDGRVHYFVKWKGWPSESNTWEPLDNLTDCEKRLKDYYDELHKTTGTSGDISMEEVEKFRHSLVDTSRETLEGVMSKIMTPQGLFYSVPKEVYIHKELCALLSVPEHARNPVDVKRVKRKLVFRALHVARSEQMKSLKEWEDEMNTVSNDRAPITVENMVDLEGPPPNFHYINDYIPGNGVTIPEDPPIGCNCKTCDGRSKGCCSKQVGSQFAYSANRLLKVPAGSPIYECNKRCQCGPDCINRVVQNGRKVKLSIFRTATGCGWGVKALEEIKKGTFVCEYVGEVIHSDEAESRGKSYDADGRTYLFDLDYNDKEHFPYTVDAATFGNISHFINHSCSPNLAVYAVWINCLDPYLPKLALFAMHNIKKGEEVTFDYIKQQVNNPVPTGVESSPCSRVRLSVKCEDSSDGEFSSESSQRIMCKCKSKHCRGFLF